MAGREEVEGLVELLFDHRMHLLALKSLLGQVIGEVALLDGQVDELGNEGEERFPGVRGVKSWRARSSNASRRTMTTAWNRACLVGKWR